MSLFRCYFFLMTMRRIQKNTIDMTNLCGPDVVGNENIWKKNVSKTNELIEDGRPLSYIEVWHIISN